MLNDLDDMQYLLEENSIDGIPYLRPRRRQIARTRISERVRARIQEYREGLARLVCDDEEPEASDEEVSFIVKLLSIVGSEKHLR